MSKQGKKEREKNPRKRRSDAASLLTDSTDQSEPKISKLSNAKQLPASKAKSHGKKFTQKHELTVKKTLHEESRCKGKSKGLTRNSGFASDKQIGFQHWKRKKRGNIETRQLQRSEGAKISGKNQTVWTVDDLSGTKSLGKCATKMSGHRTRSKNKKLDESSSSSKTARGQDSCFQRQRLGSGRRGVPDGYNGKSFVSDGHETLKTKPNAKFSKKLSSKHRRSFPSKETREHSTGTSTLQGLSSSYNKSQKSGTDASVQGKVSKLNSSQKMAGLNYKNNLKKKKQQKMKFSGDKCDTTTPNVTAGHSRTSRRSCTATASSTGSADTEEDTFHIPGFYYDKEKKRYFKIAAGHTGNSITKESIVKKETEEKRRRDIKKYLSTRKETKPKPTFQNIVPLVNKYFLGSFDFESLCSKLLMRSVCNLKPLSEIEAASACELDPAHRPHLEHMHVLDVNKEHNKLLTLWSLKGSWLQRLQLIEIAEKDRTSTRDSLSLVMKPGGRLVLQSHSKITHVCWAPLTLRNTDRKHVLYTTMCYTGQGLSMARIRDMDDTITEHSRSYDFNLGSSATWTCAWNIHQKKLSVGSEKVGLLLDIHTRKLWEMNTHGSDPLAQVFSHQCGNYLHSGTRKGHILTHDLRSSSTRPKWFLVHPSCISSMNLLENDVHLVASDFTGKTCMWDLRSRKIVVEYPGNKNEYTKIPLHVDETEKILYGGICLVLRTPGQMSRRAVTMVLWPGWIHTVLGSTNGDSFADHSATTAGHKGDYSRGPVFNTLGKYFWQCRTSYGSDEQIFLVWKPVTS